MAGNSEKIDTIIDEAAIKQIKDATDYLMTLDKQINANIASAIKFNALLGGAKTPGDLAKSQKDIADAMDKTQASIEKNRLAEIKLQQAREKAFDDYEKKLNAKIAAEAKAAAAEVANQQKIQAQIDATAAAAAKRASVIGPTYTGSTGSSAELTRAEAEAIGAKSRAEQMANVAAADAATAESLKAAATNQATEANNKAAASVRAESEALSASQRIMNQQIGTLEQNIKIQLQLATELKTVQDAQKKVTSGTKEGQQAIVSLNAEEQRLKAAIQQNSVVIKQQAKDQNAAATSGDGLNARLALLRTTYTGLTEAERQNKQIGGVLLVEIKQLDEATKQIAADQGLYNKSVGDYENAIKRAISANVPYGATLVKGIDALKSATNATDTSANSLNKLAIGFASFTIGVFAVAILSAKYYLSQFQDVADKTDQRLNGLKNTFSSFGRSELNGSGNIFKTFAALLTPLNPNSQAFLNQKLDSTKKAFNQGVDIQKAIQDLEAFNDVNDAQIKQQQAQADQFRAMAKNRKTDKDDRLKYLNDAQAIEKQILSKQKANSELNIEIAIEVSEKVKKINGDTRKELEKGDIALANALVRSGDITKQGYEIYKAAIDRKTSAQSSATMKLIRQQNDEDNLTLKGAKQANTDQLQLDKAKLEAQKLNAQLILQDESQSYEARLAALKLFTIKSKQLVENERQTANSAPGTSSTKRKANNQIATNQLTQIDIDTQSEEQKIYLERNAKFTKDVSEQLQRLDESRKKANEAELSEVNKNKNDVLAALADQYSEGKISQIDYLKQKQDVEESANYDLLEISKKQTEDLKHLQEMYGIDTTKTDSDLAALTLQIAEKKAAGLAAIQQKEYTEAKRLSDNKIKLYDQEAKAANTLIDVADAFVKARAKRRSEALDEQSSALDKATQAQIDAVNRGIGSDKQKADKTAVIEAKAQQQKDDIARKQAENQRKQAQFEKILSLARIAITAAESIAKIQAAAAVAFTIPFIGPGLAAADLAQIPFVLGTAAAEAAIILATPLPKFKDGVRDKKASGLGIWGEAGIELGIIGNHAILSPDKPTIAHMPKGMDIFSHAELMRMISKPDLPVYAGGREIDVQSLIAESKRSTSRLETAFMQREKVTGFSVNSSRRARWEAYKKRNLN